METWFSLITEQSICRATFSSISALTSQTRTCIGLWNTHREPFVWAAAADEILARIRLAQTKIKRLVDNLME